MQVLRNRWEINRRPAGVKNPGDDIGMGMDGEIDMEEEGVDGKNELQARCMLRKTID